MTEFIDAERHLPLVYSLARRLANSSVEYDELVGAGNLGLIKAIKNYDATLGFAFSTYAVPVILGEMKRYIRDNGPVKVSRTLKENYMLLKRIISDYEGKTGESPTISKLAALSGLSEEDVAQSLDSAKAPLSIDDDSAADIGAPDSALDVEKLALTDAINALPDDEGRLIKLRYFHGLTQKETAFMLSLTQVQVSRREKKILDKLKTILDA